MGETTIASRLVVVQGKMEEETAEAVVNATSASLLAGSGLSGALHKKAGKKLEEACMAIRRESYGSKPIPIGQAVWTEGYGLPATYVIHVPGPIWRSGQYGEEVLLHKSYQNVLYMAKLKGVQTLAVPSISTGANRFPLTRAATIAIRTILEELEEPGSLKEVRLVLENEKEYSVYAEAASLLMKKPR